MLCDCCGQWTISHIIVLEAVSDLGFDEAEPFGLCLFCYLDYQITVKALTIFGSITRGL